MRLSSSLKCMSFVTLLALIYIHMQMQIIDLAYQGKRKEKDIIKLVEENGMVSYNILALKSSNNLGRKLLAKDSDLRFRDRGSVVELAVADPEAGQPRILTASQSKPTNPILNFFLRSEAEARAQERKSLRPWRQR